MIVATGLAHHADGRARRSTAAGSSSNVMNPLAMERIQSSNGPYGRVLRPADGKIPRSIAYVQCAGSRDRSIGVPYCSRVCCMYALKQALLLRHYIHDVEVTLYYMDIRAFGKGYEQFYRRAVAEGVKVVKGKVARITEAENFDLMLRVELLDEDGRVDERRVTTSSCSARAWSPAWHPGAVLASRRPTTGSSRPRVARDPPDHDVDGIFVAGVAAGPKDIPDAIVEAGEAAMAAAIYLDRMRAGYASA